MAHIRVLIESIRLCAKQLKEAHRQLDRLCKLLAEPLARENEQTGPEPGQTIVAILQSLPGAGRIVLAVLLAEAFENPAAGRLRRLTQIVRRCPGHPALGKKPCRYPKVRL